MQISYDSLFLVEKLLSLHFHKNFFYYFNLFMFKFQRFVKLFFVFNNASMQSYIEKSLKAKGLRQTWIRPSSFLSSSFLSSDTIKARPQHSGQGQGQCKKVTQDITRGRGRVKGGHSSLGARAGAAVGAGARTRVATAFTRGRGRDITQDITRDMKETS